MKRLSGLFGSSNSSAGLELSEVTNRLSDDVRGTIRKWPFSDRPLHLPELDPTITTFARPSAGSVLRFAGVFTSVDTESGHATLHPFDESGGLMSATTLAFDVPLGEYGKRFAHLRGLIMDVALQLGEQPEEGADRAGSLMAVHGIERQIVMDGARSGLLRGEITEIVRNHRGEGTYGCEVRGERDALFQVLTNPSNVNDAWAPGNFVALRVLGGGPKGVFGQDRQPGWPLQHSILLQEAVVPPAV